MKLLKPLNFAQTPLFHSLLALSALTLALWLSQGKTGGDTIAFWGGVQLFLGGSNPYDPVLLLPIQQSAVNSITTPQYFFNPPWSLALLVPLFAPPFETSRFILSVSNVVGFLYAIAWCQKRWGAIPSRWSILLPLYTPFIACQLIGQLSIAPLIGLLLVIDDTKVKQHPAKLALGLYLCSIKPQGLYLVILAAIFFIFKRDGIIRLLRVALYASPLLVLMLYRADLLDSWIQTFSYSSRWRTSSTTTYLRDLLLAYAPHYANLFWLYQVTVIVAVFAVGVGTFFKNDNFLLLLLLSVLTAPYAWLYDFCVLLPVFYFSLLNFVKQPWQRGPRGLLATVTALTLLFFIVVPLYGSLSRSFEIYIIYSLLIAAFYLVTVFASRTKIPQSNSTYP